MNRQLLIMLLTGSAVLLSACGPKYGTAEYAQEQAEYTYKEQSKAATETLDNAPSWYLKPPVANDAIYGVATAFSRDLQFSIEKAAVDAKGEIASQLSDKVNMKFKSFARETGTANDPVLVREVEKVASELVNGADIAGYVIEKKEVQQQLNGYRTFVLIRYPLGEANRVIVEKAKHDALLDSKVRESKAFQELEAEVNGVKQSQSQNAQQIDQIQKQQNQAAQSQSSVAVPNTSENATEANSASSDTNIGTVTPVTPNSIAPAEPMLMPSKPAPVTPPKASVSNATQTAL